VGADGDLTIFDPDHEWVFDLADTASKSKNSPFGGWRLKGRATAVIVRGGVTFARQEAGAASALLAAR
jgi:dihydroorotase